jgi:hypothetical protein
MKVLQTLRGGRRASLAAAFAAGVVLLVAPLSAAVVNPWAAPAVSTQVATVDNAGVNVLEPAEKGAAPAVAVKIPGAQNAERAVGEWNPTGGGGSGGGSPKQ